VKDQERKSKRIITRRGGVIIYTHRLGMTCTLLELLLSDNVHGNKKPSAASRHRASRSHIVCRVQGFSQ
jgi:hypothetical protein